jgi:opacity protein-like surface antigen
MKKLALIAALATALASQAFAQSYDQDEGTGNIVNPVQAQGTNGQFGVGTGAYASAPYDNVPSTSVPKRVRHAQKLQMN